MTTRCWTAALALAATSAGAGAYLFGDSACVIDGDTIELDRAHVRIWGIKASDRPGRDTVPTLAVKVVQVVLDLPAP